ncbi:hypothetical protein EV363DRAFT_1265735 [Boletus edulis]|nr:hypothetical protein EV363DRAFT_1194110 [Boletus edulis]KAF8128223.1 hypothetical protein EV363DRAFT_1265735 [Boletus edulis]
MICKKGHVRCPMATSKPFVVCSVATKRYAPSTKDVSRDSSLPLVVPKAEPRVSLAYPISPANPIFLSLIRHSFTHRRRHRQSTFGIHRTVYRGLRYTDVHISLFPLFCLTYIRSSTFCSHVGAAKCFRPCRRFPPHRFAPSKPFVVCSLSTKRYAPSRRVSVQKWPVSPKQRLSSRNGSLPSVALKAEPRPRLGCTACSRNHQYSVLADVDLGG